MSRNRRLCVTFDIIEQNIKENNSLNNSMSFALGEKSILQRFNWSTRGIILFSPSTSISFERRTRKNEKRMVSSQLFREFLKIL